MLLYVSVQIENNRFRIYKSASSNLLLFLTTALCNATLALNKWKGLTLMLYLKNNYNLPCLAYVLTLPLYSSHRIALPW